jgi:hypothetical protein
MPRPYLPVARSRSAATCSMAARKVNPVSIVLRSVPGFVPAGAGSEPSAPNPCVWMATARARASCPAASARFLPTTASPRRALVSWKCTRSTASIRVS